MYGNSKFCEQPSASSDVMDTTHLRDVTVTAGLLCGQEKMSAFAFRDLNVLHSSDETCQSCRFHLQLHHISSVIYTILLHVRHSGILTIHVGFHYIACQL